MPDYNTAYAFALLEKAKDYCVEFYSPPIALVKGRTRSGGEGGMHIAVAVRIGTRSEQHWLYLDSDGIK